MRIKEKEVLKLIDEIMETFPSLKFERVESCQECAYFEDCKEFWNFCPYDGKLAVEKREDLVILEDAEVIA